MFGFILFLYRGTEQEAHTVQNRCKSRYLQVGLYRCRTSEAAAVQNLTKITALLSGLKTVILHKVLAH